MVEYWDNMGANEKMLFSIEVETYQREIITEERKKLDKMRLAPIEEETTDLERGYVTNQFSVIRDE